jgi:hypothetical protein
MWCHSPVEPSAGSHDPGAAGTLAEDEAQAFDAVARTWTLRSDGPQIDWSAGVASPGTPTRRLIDTLHDGLQQPAGQELAADPQLDRELCAVLADAMTLTREGPVCDVIEAIVASPGTDPAWADRARDDVKRVRKLVEERHKFDARAHTGEVDETPPPHLAAWVATKLEHAPRRRRHW